MASLKIDSQPYFCMAGVVVITISYEKSYTALTELHKCRQDLPGHHTSAVVYRRFGQ